MQIEPNEAATIAAVISAARVGQLLGRASVRRHLARLPPSVVTLIVSLAVIAAT
jgi:hypothetical protein